MHQFKHEIAYWWLDIEFFFKLKFHLTATMITSLEPKENSTQPPFYTITANSPVGCAFCFLLMIFFFDLASNYCVHTAVQ